MPGTIPAAAVKEGDYVRLHLEDGDVDFTVECVENATPQAGLIRWTDQDGMEYIIGGSQDVEVLSLVPKE